MASDSPLNDSSLASSVLQPLGDNMRCGVFTNEGGHVLIVYDKAIEGSIEWIEYHKEDNNLFFVYEDGRIQDLGVVIDKETARNLTRGKQVTLSHVQDKVIHSNQAVQLIIQEH